MAKTKSLAERAVDIFTRQYELATDLTTKSTYLHGLAEIGLANKKVEKVVLDALNGSPEMIAIACNTVKCTGLNADSVVGQLTQLLLGNVSQKVVADALAHVAGDNAMRIFISLCGKDKRRTDLAVKSIVTTVRHPKA